jgi:hypothetical protein
VLTTPLLRTTLLDVSFTDGAEAERFFDDAVFRFDIAGGQHLALLFGLETSAAAPRATLDFLVATVPEPGASALLALALAVLARRNRR